MIRIVKASTLADLRREARAAEERAEMADAYVANANLDVRTAKERATDSLAKAAFYQGKANDADDRYAALYNSTVNKVAKAVTRQPESPHDADCMRGLIALHMLRDDMARVERDGTPEEKAAIQPMRAILGDQQERQAAARPPQPEAESPQPEMAERELG